MNPQQNNNPNVIMPQPGGQPGGQFGAQPMAQKPVVMEQPAIPQPTIQQPSAGQQPNPMTQQPNPMAQSNFGEQPNLMTMRPQQPPVQSVAGQSVAQQQMAQPQNMQNIQLGMTALNAQQAAPVSPTKDAPTSTQATLLISELRDNMVIMKDGSFRAVVTCKSINFDLMSDTEREAVEYSYQNFLNSLRFTTQILVRSQKVDIGPYIEKLSDIRRNNDNMLLGVLMDDYINFIDILSQEANIMDKSFFIVIPYYSSPDAEKVIQQTKNFFKSFSKAKPLGVTQIDRATYDKAMTELANRVDTVISGLFQIGIQSVRLNTKELAELYYNFNNPDTAIREPLGNFSEITNMYIRKGE